jgi:glutamyl-tRNA reductase
VGTGLDSQILGDFEIIAQIKSSFSQSKLGLMLLWNDWYCVIKPVKKNKTDTEISSELHLFLCGSAIHYQKC